MRLSAVVLATLCTASFMPSWALPWMGQAVATGSNVAGGRFASEPYIVRSFASRSRMNADGTGTREQTYVVQVQSDAAVRIFGVVSLGFAKASETGEFVYARVRRPDGTVAETAVTDAQEQPAPVTREAPTYSDLMTKQLPIRSLHVGDTVEWQARITAVKPNVPNQFWGEEAFLKGVVILSELYELSVPAATRVTVWTNPRSGSSPVETSADGRHTWSWKREDLTATVGAVAEAHKLVEEKRLLSPDEELDVMRGALPAIAWTTFADWQAVGDWYRNLIAGQNTPDSAIRAKVAELTEGKTTQLEKAQAIYTYVSSQIRYVAVSFGVGRQKPHSAAEVLQNQFGDCKDKHTLLAAMLSAIGVQADPVLMGVGIRFNAVVPSPASFNHLITQAMIDDEPAWLDSTNEVAPWRALLYGVRDREALLVPATAAAKVEQTPADLPYPASTTVVVKSVLDGKLTSESEMVYVFHDDTEFGIRLALRKVPASSYAEAVQQMMRSFGFAGITSNAVIEHLSDTSKPLAIRFHYHREHDESWGLSRVTIPFGPDFLPAYADDRPPTFAIQLGGPRTLISTVDIVLPADCTVTMPDAVHERASFAEGEESYKRTGRQLHAEKKLVVLRRDVNATDFRKYQQWFQKANAGSVPFLRVIHQ